CLSRRYRNRDAAGVTGGYRVAVRWSSRSRPVQLFGSIARDNSNRPIDHLNSVDRLELVRDGHSNGGDIYALHGTRESPRQYIAAARDGERPQDTDASHTNRRARRHTRAWHDWSICGADRAFDRLAAGRRLDTG